MSGASTYRHTWLRDLWQMAVPDSIIRQDSYLCPQAIPNSSISPKSLSLPDGSVPTGEDLPGFPMPWSLGYGKLELENAILSTPRQDRCEFLEKGALLREAKCTQEAGAQDTKACPAGLLSPTSTGYICKHFSKAFCSLKMYASVTGNENLHGRHGLSLSLSPLADRWLFECPLPNPGGRGRTNQTF